MDYTDNLAVPLRVVLLPYSSESPLGRNEVELEIVGEVDLTRASESVFIDQCSRRDEHML